MGAHTDEIVRDVLATDYLMREPVTEDEARRVVHALYLADYDLRKRPPARPKKKASGARGKK